MTLPVAVEGETVAVKVTVWPDPEGLGEVASVVLVWVEASSAGNADRNIMKNCFAIM